MKREDFEELVRLLRGWLKVAESRNQEARLAHSKLVEWAELHSCDDVQKASDAIALRAGFDIERQGYPRCVMELGRRLDGKTFFSAIDAIDYLLRQVSETDFESAIDATTKPLCPWTRIQLPEIDRSLVALRARLGEELKHIEEGGEPNDCLPSSNDADGSRYVELSEQDKTFQELLKRNKVSMGSTLSDIVSRSEELNAENSQFVTISRDGARQLMNDKFGPFSERKKRSKRG